MNKKMLDFYKGMDLSFVQQCREEGVIFRDFDGKPADPFALAKRYGVNSVRLRLWKNPENIPESGGYCSLEKTLEMAREIKKNDLDFLLDFHYSDYWADPGQQNKPKEWENLSFGELVEAVFCYTRDTLLTLKEAGAMPDIVQIGNEIRSGLLFPEGELPDYQGMVKLVNAGIRGARQAGGENLLIMIHLDQGGRYFYLKEWFDRSMAEGLLDFDLIGLSYYPFWHGTFADLKQTMEQLIKDYHKPILIAETAHAWRRSRQGFIDEAQERIAGIPATSEGQKKVLELVMNITASLPNRMGRGIYYWEPFCVPKQGEGGWSENMGLLSENGTVLEGIRAFEFSREKQKPREIAKVYYPEEINILPGAAPVLPGEVTVLYFDGTLQKRAVCWKAQKEEKGFGEGETDYEGSIAGIGNPILLKVTVRNQNSFGDNLLQNPGWEEGLARWELAKDIEEVSVQIHPEFTDPFPAPPLNQLRIEAARNFHLSLSQEVMIQQSGDYCLQAEYKGTDTTNVDIRLFIEGEGGREETVVHPTEHEWQKITVRKTLLQPGALRIGIHLISPPVYGMIRKFHLGREIKEKNTDEGSV